MRVLTSLSTCFIFSIFPMQTDRRPDRLSADLALLPDFVDTRTADALLDAVLGEHHRRPTTAAAGGGGDLPPPPPSLGPGWKAAAGRAVKSAGGAVLGSTLIPAPLPAWAIALFTRLAAAGVGFGGCGGGDGEGGEHDEAARAAPNHVLINAYPAGAGILAHTDGPAYAPVAAILSLGDDSPAVIRFYPAAAAGGGGEPAPPSFSVFLPPRSLLVFKGAAYSDHRHGIEAVDEDGIDDGVLNAGGAAEWLLDQRGGGGGGTGGAPGGPPSPLTIRRGPLRVSLTVRRVKRVRAGVLRL